MIRAFAISLQQIMWKRLFQGTSSAESGTIFQLRNLIFRRNIHKDVTKNMNATEDFFEAIVTCYIIAAAMHFCAMRSSNDTPQANAFPEDIVHRSVPERTKCLRDKVAQLVDRYVLLSDLSPLVQSAEGRPKEQNQAQGIPSKEFATSRKRPREHMDNPHLQRIATDHSYISQQLELPTKRRRLPEYLANHSDTPHASDKQQRLAPDGVLNYSSSVLMLELRDAIREGDGPRIIRCWKIMMIYFKYANHANYAREAFRMLAGVYALGTPRLVHQLMWARVVNIHRGLGHNISLDLHMEHMNKKLRMCRKFGSKCL